MTNQRQSRAREIYNQAPVTFNVGPSSTASRKRSSSLTKKKKSQVTRRRKGGQPSQTNSVMLNNFFPALNQNDQDSMSQEELAALQQAMALKQANEDAMVQAESAAQLGLDDAIPEEEEGESQQVTQSRKVEAYHTGHTNGGS